MPSSSKCILKCTHASTKCLARHMVNCNDIGWYPNRTLMSNRGTKIVWGKSNVVYILLMDVVLKSHIYKTYTYLASNLKNSPEEFGCSFATLCEYNEVLVYIHVVYNITEHKPNTTTEKFTHCQYNEQPIYKYIINIIGYLNIVT